MPTPPPALTPAALPPVALTMGEPAGIGPEITLKAWQKRREEGLPPFLVLGAPDLYRQAARMLSSELRIAEIASPAEADAVFADALPVLPVPLAAPVVFGKLDAANAKAVLHSIDLACDLALAKRVAAIVTNPIHKATLYEAGMDTPGHTEYLARRTGAKTPVMMLSCPGLRTVPVTVHRALASVPAALTADAVITKGRILAASLKRDFGIAAPRIAVAGFNPHAGEDGHMGREEIDIIAPAIATLRDEGIDAFGPLPPDTMFHAAARSRYDAALCMYHDQALIPVKTIGFERGVNTTLGLSVVRTSPDHGTALDIAGQGKADALSLIEAIRLAGEIACHRAASSGVAT